MANTLYFAAYPSAAGTPTWARGDIGTNAGFSGSPTMYGTHASAPATGTNYEPTITWTGSLTPGTPYKLVALWDDGANSSNLFESAAFRSSYTLVLDSGTFAYTGGNADFLFNRAVEAAGVTFAYTGGDAALTFNRALIAEGGAFTHTGGDATLTYTPIAAENTLNAESGAFSYSGGDATFLFNRALAADSGTFSYTGGDTTLSRNWTLSAESGAFTYAGGDTAFLRTYVLEAESGAFTLNGGDATFTYSGGPVVVPATPQVGGGRPKKTRRRRVQVEIDGEVIEVESLDEAQAVLAEAAQKATETAKIAVERASKAKRRPVRKIIRDAEKAFTVPKVSVPPRLQSYADQMIGQIRAEYQSALSAIEIAAHMAKREREIEEDDEEVLMLL